MVDVEAKNAKKGTPEEAHGHRFRRHNVLQKAKKLMSQYGRGS
jgi:hypothetical protein